MFYTKQHVFVAFQTNLPVSYVGAIVCGIVILFDTLMKHTYSTLSILRKRLFTATLRTITDILWL